MDRVVIWLVATFVDGRAFPMFGLLFGYGVAQIVRRHEATGRRAVRRMLWRRSLFLVVVGFLHAMLLYVGDILAAYGVLLLVGSWVVWWRDRWLWVWASLLFVMISLPGVDSMSISTDGPDPSMLPAALGAMFAERIVVQPWIMFLGPVGFACPFLVGLWAGRRRLLELPNEHRRLLTAVAATGQRSMTCYLAQSVVWALVFTPFLLGLASTLTVTTTALIAVATWVATVLLADWMQRTGRRGPFEVLVRRVTYAGSVRG